MLCERAPCDAVSGLSMTLGARATLRLSAQKVVPESLTFSQAQDGALHCTLSPSASASANTYPVYKRSVLPQAQMPVSAP